MFVFVVSRFRFLWVLAFCTGSLCLQAQSIPPAATSSNFQSLAQAASSARDAGKTDEAASDYARALAIRPEWAEGWWELGTMQYEASRYPDAAASLKKLVAIAPNMAPGWSILGLSQFETKDYDAAFTSLKKAQKIGGDDPDIERVSAFHLALLLIRNGDFEEAMQLLRNAVGESTSSQVKGALGLAALRIPLLPMELNPTQEAFIVSVGDAWSSSSPDAVPQLLQQHPTTPWLHYSYGLSLADDGKDEEALAQQKIETRVSPDSALPWIAISDLSIQLKQKDEALDAAKKAVALNAQSSAAHDSMAKAFAASGNMQQATAEKHAAERLGKDAPYRDPKMIALYGSNATTATPGGLSVWNAAMQSYSAGRYQEAITALNNWLAQSSTDGTAWAVLGLSEFALKDYANARIHLKRGIDLGLKGSPDSIELANDCLAQLMIREGQFDAATALLTPLTGHPPIKPDTQLTLGLALLRMPMLPDELDAKQHELAQTAGGIVELLLASRYAEAFPAFQKLIAENPTTPWLHYAYGGALDSLSQYDDAKTQMREELKLSPHSASPWTRLASIATQQHAPAEALSAAQNAVELEPDSAEARYELGRAWLESGDAQKAIDQLLRADSIRPDNPEIHFVLARAYTKAGQPDKAALEREEFMRLKARTSQDNPTNGSNDSLVMTRKP